MWSLVVVLLVLVFVVNGGQDAFSACIITDGLEPAIRLDQKVATLHIRMPSFWCDGTIPSDFVFTIAPIQGSHDSDTNGSNTSTNTTSLIYTLPTLQTPLLQASQTEDHGNGTTRTTTVVTILSENTVFSRPGSFGVVIQVPAHDLETVIVERSLFWNQHSMKVRIMPGFTRLSRIVSQSADPFQDEQGIELEADISTSISSSTSTFSATGVTLDLLHHGRYRVIGNVEALNAQQHSTPHATVTNANTVVQILGNVHRGNITRDGTYTILGNITGLLAKTTGATLTTTSSYCDNVDLEDDDSCNTVTEMSATTPSIFSLQCTLVACQESGASIGDDNDGVNTCHLLTSCPVFGQPVRVSKNAELMTPESSSAAAAAALTATHLVTMVLVLVVF